MIGQLQFNFIQPDQPELVRVDIEDTQEQPDVYLSACVNTLQSNLELPLSSPSDQHLYC